MKKVTQPNPTLIDTYHSREWENICCPLVKNICCTPLWKLLQTLVPRLPPLQLQTIELAPSVGWKRLPLSLPSSLLQTPSLLSYTYLTLYYISYNTNYFSYEFIKQGYKMYITFFKIKGWVPLLEMGLNCFSLIEHNPRTSLRRLLQTLPPMMTTTSTTMKVI